MPFIEIVKNYEDMRLHWSSISNKKKKIQEAINFTCKIVEITPNNEVPLLQYGNKDLLMMNKNYIRYTEEIRNNQQIILNFKSFEEQKSTIKM